MSEVVYRHPNINDGRKIYELIKACPPLDVNSQYYYHIMCGEFSKTCVIAEIDGVISGFISGYLNQERINCLFIWQVAVTEKARGRKLGLNMLEWLTKQSKCSCIRSIETTISPSNKASQQLFKQFANQHNANCKTTPFLDQSHFGTSSHEEEVLYIISPLN